MKIGMIGGFGPEATLLYYKEIIRLYRAETGGLSCPEIIIYSADIEKLFSLVQREKLEELADWLLQMTLSLKNAGADFVAISANTPHVVFQEVQSRSPLPLISIVTTAARAAKNLELKKVGLLGTIFTMKSSFFQSEFLKHGIEVVVPSLPDQEYIQGQLVKEVEYGIVTEPTKSGFLRIVEKMKEGHGIQGLILGCTELPLVLSEEHFGLKFLDTTALHAAEIVAYCLTGQTLNQA